MNWTYSLLVFLSLFYNVEQIYCKIQPSHFNTEKKSEIFVMGQSVSLDKKFKFNDTIPNIYESNIPGRKERGDVLSDLNNSNVNGAWTNFGGNSQNTSSNKESTLTYPVKSRYTNNYIGEYSERAIVIGDTLIFFNRGLQTNKIPSLNVVNIHTGQEIWKLSFNEKDKFSTCAYYNGRIYFQNGNSSNGKLYCYHLSDGEMMWEVPVPVQHLESKGPVVENGRVFVLDGYYDASIGAYNADTGDFLWSTQINNKRNDDWIPTYLNDTLYAYAENLVAINPQTGEIYYKLDTSDIPFTGFALEVMSSVIDSINNLIILTTRYNIYALNLHTKEIQWTFNALNYESFRLPPSLFDNSIYIGTDARVMQLNVRTGELEWEDRKYRGTFQSVVNSEIVVFSDNNRIVIFDKETMEIQHIINQFCGHLTLSTDYLIVTSMINGDVIVLEFFPSYTPIEAEIVIAQPISCYGGADGALKVIITQGEGDYNFRWDDPNSNKTAELNNIMEGEYSLTITDKYGGVRILKKLIVNPEELKITINSMPEVNMEENGSIHLDVSGGYPPYNFEWLDFPGLNVANLNYLRAGDYDVKIVDSKSCELDTIIHVDTNTGIYESAKDDNFQIYPNPTHDEFNVVCLEKNTIGSILVLNSNGKKVYTSGIISLENHRISLANNPAGMYFVKINSDTSNFILKLFLI